jgi:hypothetical protein
MRGKLSEEFVAQWDEGGNGGEVIMRK